MPARDHRDEILTLYNERYGRPDKYPEHVWHRAPQIMRDRGWSAEKALDYIMGGGDPKAVVIPGFPPRPNY